MSIFSRRSWPPDDFPDMTFGREPPFVDIGYLGGDEHRRAFVQLFERMLQDNAEALSGFLVIGIDGERQLRPETVGACSFPTALASMIL